VAIMLQLLDGLSAAHAAGVLHRDVKPGNIFITSPRQAPPTIKIIDFGLAKVLPVSIRTPSVRSVRSEDYSTITTTDVIPGTPFYLAPEQVRGARDLDERVDVWAAGVTFYELLVGRRAYEGASYAAVATSILLHSLAPVSTLRADIPATFDEVVARAIAKDRDARFPTTAAFRAALVDVWARFRTEGLARGASLGKFRPEAKTIAPTDADNDISGEDETEIDVRIEFDPDG
jgi:serine/threonine-protein kinase